VHEHPGAVHVPGGGQQPPAQPVNVLVDGVHHRQGGVDLQPAHRGELILDDGGQ